MAFNFQLSSSSLILLRFFLSFSSTAFPSSFARVVCDLSAMAEVERREDHVMPLPSEERVESSQDAKEPWPRLLAALHSALDGDTADIDDICAVLDA